VSTGAWPRPPGAYLHGSVVVVPARVAAWMDATLRLREVRTAVRAADAEVYSVLVAIRLAALTWRNGTSGSGQQAAPQPASTPGSQLMTTTQAAAITGVSDRTIRRAVSGGTLPARKHGGRWLITSTDLDQYRARAR
jgi:excisionase family DNA binding protein